MLAGCSSARAFRASADELVGDLGRARGVRRLGPDRERRLADLLRVGLGQALLQSLAAEEDHEPVLAHRLARTARRRESGSVPADRAEPRAGLGRDAAGAPVGDQALPVHRAEVAARRQVLSLRAKSMPTASRTPRPIRYCSGSYPNSPRCPGPLPGVMPGATGSASPSVRLGRQRVEIRRLRRLQLRLSVERPGQPAHAVHHQQDDLRLRRSRQGFQIIERDHPGLQTSDVRCVMRIGRDHINTGGNRPALRATVHRNVPTANPDEANLAFFSNTARPPTTKTPDTPRKAVRRRPLPTFFA